MALGSTLALAGLPGLILFRGTVCLGQSLHLYSYYYLDCLCSALSTLLHLLLPSIYASPLVETLPLQPSGVSYLRESLGPLLSPTRSPQRVSSATSGWISIKISMTTCGASPAATLSEPLQGSTSLQVQSSMHRAGLPRFLWLSDFRPVLIYRLSLASRFHLVGIF